MTGQAHGSIRPFVLEGTRGPLMCVYFPRAAGTPIRGDLLFTPPFEEEMNRCRAMVSMQARALAKRGFGTLVLDPYGTGDSGGEYADATWEGWRDDLNSGIGWLNRHGHGCRAIWGIRLGALMAACIAQDHPGIEHLLFWQPVLSGKTYFTQFLRLRIAAEIGQAGGVKSTDELRALFASGDHVDVSGYRVTPALATALERLKMPTPEQLQARDMTWFEVVPSAEATVPRSSIKAVEDSRNAGGRVDFSTVVGPPFWQVHEREIAPELVTATCEALDRWGDWKNTRASTGPTALAVTGSDSAEYPVVVPCESEELMGVVHRSGSGRSNTRGVVIVVAGGPQYRAGAHRQFVNLARKLARTGYPVLRFDLRGMGDSSGVHLGYRHSEPDIRAAIDVLMDSQPQLQDVVLFGECSSASGILFYAWRDPRVTAIALTNPWVRTDEGRAQVILKHYYLDRLRSREFWRSVARGHYDVVESLRSFLSVSKTYLRGKRATRQAMDMSTDMDIASLPLPQGTAAGLRRFSGEVMLLMSGRDYIALEFDEVVSSSPAWRGLLESPKLRREDLADADHTFSKEQWKRQASDLIVEWMDSLEEARA